MSKKGKKSKIVPGGWLSIVVVSVVGITIVNGIFGEKNPPEETTAPYSISIEPTPTAFTDWWDGSVDFGGEEETFGANWVVIFDDSGSMNDRGCSTPNSKRKIDIARDAALNFVGNIPAEDKVALISLNNRNSQRLGAKRSALLNALSDAYADGGTPIGAALAVSTSVLKAQGARQLGYGQYNIVVLTDGIASDEADMAKNVEKILETTPIQLFAVGFCLSSSHALNVPGQVRYFDADSADELSDAFTTILAEAESFDASASEGFN